ncbi:MAG TPA: helix-turn-helix domain-containing protein [Pseudonocardia sp.]|nr:helix-turn-helix domain-containing protein [Pseudonocardia sp.]
MAAAALGGAAPPLEARRSWLQARLALRFAAPGAAEAFVDHDALGTLALLAEVPAQRLRTDPDVLALDALAATRAGAQDVAALDAFCRTGSLRQAAAELHLHHSSVAARLARVEQAVGWGLDNPGDRFRARLALVARRLAGSA